MIKIFNSLILIFYILFFTNCSSTKTSNIPYINKAIAKDSVIPELNIFSPKKTKLKPVIIFIHGGYWDQGNKNIYGFLGRNFSRKDVVTVIPSYTLSPDGNYDTMAKEVAAAIKWTYKNIEKHNGDPQQIFLMGHSAGGHLIALASTNPKYLENSKMIKGVVLNDAAGLDMYSYLKQSPPTQNHNFKVTWTENEANWKEASPIYYLSENTPPFLIYLGTKTFPSIINQNEGFVQKLKQYQPNIEINLIEKKHVPMMRQFISPWNKCYEEIILFINSNK